MFGVDNTFLSRVVDEDVFEPYEADGLDAVPDELRALVPDGEATPDRLRRRVRQLRHGLVRRARPRAAGRPRRARRPGLRRPARRAEPGDVVARAGVRAGDDRRVRRGRLDRLLGAACATTASRSSTAGPRPTTSASPAPATGPSRSSSATARARRPRSCSPTRRSTPRRPPSIDTTCFRQVEFAGVLRGTEHGDEARQLVDFLLSRALPGRAAAEPVRLPGERRRRRCPTCSPTTPRSPPTRPTLDPATIAANREAWIAEWTDTVLR